jgi:hypothetical protein
VEGYTMQNYAVQLGLTFELPIIKAALKSEEFCYFLVSD